MSSKQVPTTTTTTDAAAAAPVIDGARMRPWPPFAKRGETEAWHVVVPAGTEAAAITARVLDHVMQSAAREERTDKHGNVWPARPAIYVNGVKLTGELFTFAHGGTVMFDQATGEGHVRLIMAPRPTVATPSKVATGAAAKRPAKRGTTTTTAAKRGAIDGALA